MAPSALGHRSGVAVLGFRKLIVDRSMRWSTTLRYGMHADRKTSGVHAGQAGEPMQKPSLN
jgi:hypothetical protein